MKIGYQAKSLDLAQRRIALLERRLAAEEKLSRQLIVDRRRLAMLAADGPGFGDPLERWKAQALRDGILRDECGCNPDGTIISR